MKTLICLLLSLTSVISHTAAQTSTESRPEPDQQFRRLLDEANLPSSIDKDGDFRITINVGNGRTQLVVAYSGTTKFESLTARRIISAAYLFTPPMSGELAQRLLKLNNTYKMGGWRLVGPRQDGKMIVQFAMLIPPVPDAASLKAAIQIIAITADDLEKELATTDDF